MATWYNKLASSAYHGTGDFVDNLTGKTGANAAVDAANIQAGAANNANNTLKGIYDQSRADNAPFLKIGQDAATSLAGQVNSGAFNNPAFPTYQGPQGPGAFKYAAFDPSQVQNEPGYQFGLNQGLSSVENRAAAGRMLHSGNTLTGLEKFAQDYAGTKLDNAFNRYSTGRNQALNEYNTGVNQFNANRNFDYGQSVDQYNSGVNAQQARFNRLSQLAGYGPAAQAQNSNLGANFGNAYGNNMLGGANAQAAGIVGAANSRTAGTQNLMSLAAKGAGGIF